MLVLSVVESDTSGFEQRGRLSTASAFSSQLLSSSTRKKDPTARSDVRLEIPARFPPAGLRDADTEFKMASRPLKARAGSLQRSAQLKGILG